MNFDVHRRLGWWFLAALTAVMLTACSSRSLNRAPVEDRMTGSANPPAATAGAGGVDLAPVKPPQGFENAGKPGYYTVKPGDTLLRIALENGQAVKDVARWSQVENPNLIEVGQVLRVVPPVSGDVVVKPVAKPSVTASTVVLPPSVAIAPALAASAVAKPVAADSDIKWIWPASGVVVAGFDEARNKGLDIGGTAGEAVVAAADGRVVYVGAGLRGYGNLIILKHDNVYLTAYAHNQTLLVKEDQTVLKGQKIAEMGNSDAERVKLHFEVRRQGKPVDPVKYLPPR
ncbi:MAG: peptidoglycan DD-metalloendopeptidase family protein [Rhodoferax sp.]|nr:peptidoglycan DD-metalloendopeptidase family protein [Rhodoferax sp.]